MHIAAAHGYYSTAKNLCNLCNLRFDGGASMRRAAENLGNLGNLCTVVQELVNAIQAHEIVSSRYRVCLDLRCRMNHLPTGAST